MTTPTHRQHETAFCAEVSKWADRLFETNLNLPFGSSDIESFGRGSQKRQDFRVYERKADQRRGKLALCGEVKLPGTPQGRSPFDMALMQDAFNKATAEACRYFFTWNVEHLALFDRSRWDAPSMHERCIGEWRLGLELNKPGDVTRPEVIGKLKDEFLPKFFYDFADLWSGRRADLGQRPSDFYVTVLESHLSGPMGPVRELRDHLAAESERNRSFDVRLRTWMVSEQQWNFDRTDPNSWREAIDRAARSMAYVLSNRILFYQAVRLRNQLPELRLPRSAKTPEKAYEYLRSRFEDAVYVTGDYEPVFFPETREWAAIAALSGVNSIEAWAKFIQAVDRFNFKEIPTDILGHTFQKLISPEERHKFGQHYTDENIVDVINAFCIRKAKAGILDPACGSGTFLVRAWYRKSYLDKRLSNQELLQSIYGCEINAFPAHLATLNLAARNISNEENYPRVARKNFFTVTPTDPFCQLPTAVRDHHGRREKENIALPKLDAVVGNPPYVRYQDIPKRSDKGVIFDSTKEFLQETVERAWPGTRLSGQSDIHVYFWPVASQFLSENGWFGFLTSSSWLDARYGFRLQRWVLSNFCLLAVIESVDEPWFEDARVKTAVTIMQKCADKNKRDENLVRFVRINRPLAEVLGVREDEQQRQEAAEHFRNLILATKTDVSRDIVRILVRRQGDLWRDGLSVAQMFAKLRTAGLTEDSEVVSEAGEVEDTSGESPKLSVQSITSDYGGGKWGRYLRAPDLYFEIMRELGGRFIRLGEIASIKYGILSGCDAFFMPRNVSSFLLEKHQSELEWRMLPLMRRCSRTEVKDGNIAIVECGDGTLHPIEARFLKPEVHSLMQINRPVVSPEQLDRVVLWVEQDLETLKGTYVHHYIVWGSKQTFASKKSKSVPVPERPGCAGRNPWYGLTGRKPGIGFWPMAQKYRHIIPYNPQRLPCNHNLFDIHATGLNSVEEKAFMAVLNSTIVGLFKHFYGRYAGSEGTLKTEIVDVLMMDIPSPLEVSVDMSNRLGTALENISKREITHLVEQSFLDCHTEAEMRELQEGPLTLPLELQRSDRRELDLLVFELLGERDAARRNSLVDHLYRETALYYRGQRIQDIQSTINRSRGGGGAGEASQLELAIAAWDQVEADWKEPLRAWLEMQATALGSTKTILLPEGAVRLPAPENFFESTTLYFGEKPAVSMVCDTRAMAELLYAIACEGVRGTVRIPIRETECRELLQSLRLRLREARQKFEELAQQSAGNEKLREKVVDHLYRWMIYGQSVTK